MYNKNPSKNLGLCTIPQQKSLAIRLGRQRNKPYACMVCTSDSRRWFGTVNDLTRHQKTVHAMYEEGDLFWMCKVSRCMARQKRWFRLDNFTAHILKVHGQDHASSIKRACHVFRKHPRQEQPISRPVDQDDSGVSVNSEVSTCFADLTIVGDLFEENQSKASPPDFQIENSAPEQHHIVQEYSVEGKETHNTLLRSESPSSESHRGSMFMLEALRSIIDCQSGIKVGPFPLHNLANIKPEQLNQLATLLGCSVLAPHYQAGTAAYAWSSNGTPKTHATEKCGTEASTQSGSANPSRASHKRTGSAEYSRPSREDNGEDDCGDSTPHPSVHKEGVHQQQRYFACPYWKADPFKHLPPYAQRSMCAACSLKDITAVKQHLFQRHKKPEYFCSVCFETFTSQQKKDAHRIWADCSPEMKQFTGIMSDEAHDQLETNERGESSAAAWYWIFEILFPHERRPSSPYTDDTEMRIDHQVSIYRTLGPILAHIFYANLTNGTNDAESAQVIRIAEEAYQIFSLEINQSVNGQPSCSDQFQNGTLQANDLPEQDLYADDAYSPTHADLAAVGSTFYRAQPRAPACPAPSDSGIAPSSKSPSLLLDDSDLLGRLNWLTDASHSVWQSPPPTLHDIQHKNVDNDTITETGDQGGRALRASDISHLCHASSPSGSDQNTLIPDSWQTSIPEAVDQQNKPPIALDAKSSQAADTFAQIVLALHEQAIQDGSLPFLLCSGERSDASAREPRNSDDHQASLSTDPNTSHEKRKRKAKQRSDEEEQGSDAEVTNRQPKKQKVRTPPRIFLACPWNKKNAERYSAQNYNILEKGFRKCGSCTLHNIPALKLHIERTHQRPAFYCGICFFSFKTPREFEAHQQLRSCIAPEQNPFSDCPEPAAMQEISNVRQRNGDWEQAWYEIWAILFPGAERPQSPYASEINEQLVEPIVQYQETIFRQLGPLAHVIYRILHQQSNTTQAMETITQEIVDEAYRRVGGRLIAPAVSRNQISFVCNQTSNIALQASGAAQQPGNLRFDMNGHEPPPNNTTSFVQSSGHYSQGIGRWQTPSLISHQSRTPMTQLTDIPSDIPFDPPQTIHNSYALGLDSNFIPMPPTITFEQPQDANDTFPVSVFQQWHHGNIASADDIWLAQGDNFDQHDDPTHNVDQDTTSIATQKRPPHM